MTSAAKAIARRIMATLGYEVRRVPGIPDDVEIPDRELYRPLFSPWLGSGPFGRIYARVADHTLVSMDRCYVLHSVAQQALHVPGDFWECGVYRGGTAALLAEVLSSGTVGKKLYLFDTFQGMPATKRGIDAHGEGDFADTSLEAVSNFVAHTELCVYRAGLIPETFSGLESSTIALVHVDLDIYESVRRCLEFVWPLLSAGGFAVMDDYGFPSCPGARRAVDEFFGGTDTVPVCLQTGQALAFKSC